MLTFKRKQFLVPSTCYQPANVTMVLFPASPQAGLT